MTTVINRILPTNANSSVTMASDTMMDPRASVPCNGCTACCEKELLFLHPELGDRVEDYETTDHVDLHGNMRKILKHKPNGECIYLERGVGCTIHDRAPAICREFDCRRLFISFQREYNRKERKKVIAIGYLTKDVLDAGRERLRSLPGYMRALTSKRHANTKLGQLGAEGRRTRGGRGQP